MINTRFGKVLASNVNLAIGGKVEIGENVVLGPNCRDISIGFGSRLHRDIYIDVCSLHIGEYTTIHHGSLLHGINIKIGHNCWFGHYTIIDGLGGDTIIGNNVGVGAHSQLWSHMKFGDVLNGCRWNTSGRLHMEDDVWLVGHNIIGPIHAETKSMALAGSVTMKNMRANHIYAGTPSIDVSEKFGRQFDETTAKERYEAFAKLRKDFCASNGLSHTLFPEVTFENVSKEAISVFDVITRSYKPGRSDIEVKFIRSMLYEKAKWIPFL